MFYRSAKRDATEWETKKAIIDQLWNEQWFRDMKRIRNYAHEGIGAHVLEYKAEAVGNGQFRSTEFSRISLENIPGVQPQYSLDLPAQLTTYLVKLGAEAKKILEPNQVPAGVAT